MSLSFEENTPSYSSNNNHQTSLICSKHNILLSKTQNNNEYILNFKIYNKNINVENFLDWKIFDLLYSLNRDILDDMTIKNENNDNNETKSFTYLFKRFGKELGILQRYLTFTIKKIVLDENNILYLCRPPDSRVRQFINAEPVISDFARFNINIENKHTMNITYHYHIDLAEQLPKSMENIAGILIKKLFWRYKTFIENIE